MEYTRTRTWFQFLGLTWPPNNNVIHDNNPYAEQIKLDVERSHCFLSTEDDLTEPRAKLSLVLNALPPHLNYFQGCHSVASALLAVSGDSTATINLLLALSTGLLAESFSSVNQSDQCTQGVLRKLERIDPQLSAFIKNSKVICHFCLSWMMTGFAHNLDQINNVARIYDWWFEHPDEPTALQWLAVSLLVHCRESIMKRECNIELFKYLKELPSDELDWNTLLLQAEWYRRQAHEWELYLNSTPIIVLVALLAIAWIWKK